VKANIIKLLTVIAFALNMGLFSCNPKRIDTAELADEMKDRRVRKISQAKIVETAQKKGGLAVSAIDKAFRNKIEKELSGAQPDSAYKFCNISKFSATDSLGYILTASIIRHGRTLRTVPEEEKSFTFQVLDAYHYNAENKLSSEDNVQNIGETVILFTRPIVLKEKICFKCHGFQKQVGDQRLAFLKRKFPNSDVWEQGPDSLLGMWAVSFDKKEFIRNIK